MSVSNHYFDSTSFRASLDRLQQKFQCCRRSNSGSVAWSAGALPGELLLEGNHISLNRRDRQKPSSFDEAHKSVAAGKIALDIQLVPARGMSYIADRKAEMLGPEKRHRDLTLAMTHHVEGCELALAFGYHPMLDTNASAAVPIEPARDVAGSKDVRRAGGEILVH